MVSQMRCRNAVKRKGEKRLERCAKEVGKNKVAGRTGL